MAKRKRSEKVGLPPGSLVHVGEVKKHLPRITVIDYDKNNLEEKEVLEVEECFPFKDKPSVTWITVDGIHDAEVIRRIGKHFGFHPLLLEDIMNTEQRPKMEDFGDHIFLILKRLKYRAGEMKVEQVSLIIGHNFVITFQEEEEDIFSNIRDRLRKGKGKARGLGSDYLAYYLIDSIVDNYFLVLEKIGEKVEELEAELIEEPSTNTTQKINELKRQLLNLRKMVWPIREVVYSLERSESPLVKKTTLIYLRDVYDHTIQIIDNIEVFREMTSGMVDVYLSTMSNRMNEIMKVLTMIGTIFIPLTFITSLYGMNFEFMPELHWKYGYFLVITLMVGITVGMIFYFRKKQWM